MSDRRREKRLRRKLRIELGTGRGDLAPAGFTTNISAGGLSVRCQTLYEPGTRLTVNVVLPTEEAVLLEVQVRWTRKLNKVHAWQPAGMMGLIFVSSAPRSYLDYLADACRDPNAEYEPYHPAPGEQGGAPASGQSSGSAAPVGAAPSSATSGSTPSVGAAPYAAPSGSPRTLSGSTSSASSTASSARGASASAGPASQPAAVSFASGTPPKIAPAASQVAPPAAPRSTLAIGLAGRVESLVKAEELAAPADVAPSSLSTVAAAQLVERAAERAIASHLPNGAITLGVWLELTVSHQLPTAVGAKLITSATLTDIAPTGRMLTFEVTVTDAGRTVVTGKHVRALIERRGASPPRAAAR